MVTKRTYHDGCGMARALDLVGERWALHVVRELLLGPRRFTDLRTALPGISSRVLSQRLDELEGAAVVRRRKLPPPAASQVYELTPWGDQLGPAIDQLGRWGARSPFLEPDDVVSASSIALSFRNMAVPAAVAGRHASYEIRLGDDDTISVEIADDRVTVGRGAPPHPDAVLTATAQTLAAAVYRGAWDEALRSGELMVTGDEDAARRFPTYFRLPEPAPTA